MAARKTLGDAPFAAGFRSALEHVVQQALLGEPEDELALVALASGIETAVREQNRSALVEAAEHLREVLIVDSSGCTEFRGRVWALGVLARLGAERVQPGARPNSLGEGGRSSP